MSSLPIKEGQIRHGDNFIAKNAAVFLRHEGKLTQLVKKADITLRDIEYCRYEMNQNDILIICCAGTSTVEPTNVTHLITIGVCCIVVDGIFPQIPIAYARLADKIALENIPMTQVARFLQAKFV